MNRKLRNARAILFFESTKSPLNILVFILYLFSTFHRNSKKEEKYQTLRSTALLEHPIKLGRLEQLKRIAA